MAERLPFTSAAAALLLAAAIIAAPASADDLGSKISSTFTSTFKGLKDGILDAYEEGTEGAKILYGDAKAKLASQPNDPYRTTTETPSAGHDDLVYRVQRELNGTGYASGAPDGIYGPRTASAVRAYQINNGLAADGRVSVALYDHMRANPRRGSASLAPASVAPAGGTTTAGQICRPYEAHTTVDGKAQVTAATTCLQTDGTWKRVN